MNKDKEKVCLVIPPSLFLLDERVFPSLGVLKVAASLEAHGHEVEVLDLSGFSNYEDIVELHVKSTDSTIFGVTATTPQMPACTKVINSIRRAKKDSRIIVGGPHPTLILAACKGELKRGSIGRAHSALEILKNKSDVIVSGDGEDAIFEALNVCSSDLQECRIVDADDPKSDLFLTNAKLEKTEWPARHLIDLKSYKYKVGGYDATSLIAQLGCPFSCGFCGGRMSPMLRRIRMRSSDSIISEIRQLYDSYGYRGFMFYDDELNVNKNMVQLMNMICDLQDELGVDFRLRGFVKAELFTQEQANVMHKAGFRQLLTGFESGSPRILTNINKKAKRDDNTRAVEYAKNAGLQVKALMSIGHPGESHETINETKEWLLEVEPDDFDCTIITTYPGTPYYDESVKTRENVWTYTYKKTGDRLHSYDLDYNVTADYYKGSPDGGYQSYVYTDFISSSDLVKERDALEKDVRETLGIPFNPSAASVNFEHSMGQGQLPDSILRLSKPDNVKKKVHLKVYQ